MMNDRQPLDVSVSFDPYAGEPNRDGEQFARVTPEGKVHFRIIAKDAREVVVDRFDTLFPLESVGDGACAAPHDLAGCPAHAILKMQDAHARLSLRGRDARRASSEK